MKDLLVWACVWIFRWVILSFSAFGLLTFFYGSGAPLWSQEAAGWSQAIFSVLAIIATYAMGKRQAIEALRGIRVADRLVVKRKLDCLRGIAEACSTFAEKYKPIFTTTGFHYLNFAVHEFQVDIRHLVAALNAIPVHEIGSFDAVSSLIELKKNISYLEQALIRATRFCEKRQRRGEAMGFIPYDTSAILINFGIIPDRSARLIEALGVQLDE